MLKRFGILMVIFLWILGGWGLGAIVLAFIIGFYINRMGE